MTIFKTARKQFTLKKYHQFISFFTTRSSLYAEMFFKDSQEYHPKRRKVENDLKNAKPFSEIPFDKIDEINPILRALHKLVTDKVDRSNPILRALHKLLKYNGTTVNNEAESFKRLGPIYMKIVDRNFIISTCDVESIERLYQFEGNNPTKFTMRSWDEWIKQNSRDIVAGILLSQGEDWKQMRSLLEKQILDPKAARMYIEDINDVVSSFIDSIRQRSERNYDAKALRNLLFFWSLETMGSILYETRFGAFFNNRSQEMSLFLRAVYELLLVTDEINYKPKIDSYTDKDLQELQEIHDNAWEIIYSTTIDHVDNKSKEIDCKLKNGDNISGFLSTLIANLQMPDQEIYANIIELMLGALHWTPHIMGNVLSLLAKDLRVQEDLADEQFTVLGGKGIPTYEHLKEMPILMSVIKESLRLKPRKDIGRILAHDVNICGYRIPKGFPVKMCTGLAAKDKEHYPFPDHFMPSRWRKQGRGTANDAHPFSYVPFSAGARNCIGMNIAQLKFLLLLARLVQEFRIEVSSDGLKFIDR